MKFTEHRDPTVNMIQRVDDDRIWVNGQALTDSFYMTRDQLYPQWPIRHIEALTTELLEPVLALQPEIILLGTGPTQHFPDPALIAWCSQQGAGLEVMHNAAACRTWNVLMTEDRPCVLALIQP